MWQKKSSWLHIAKLHAPKCRGLGGHVLSLPFTFYRDLINNLTLLL